MSQASNGGYSWSASLQETNIRALYERCQRLRLTGLMRLRQSDSVLELVWVGGEPIENEGDQGTRSLPLWNSGEFVVEQRMPDFKGHLTSGIEMSGSLRPGQTQAIYKLCSDNVLSADVDLLRGSGEAAQVRFTLGKAETARINGQTESALLALSKLSGWVDGTFRVVLRPLFKDGGAAEAPVFKDAKAKPEDKFDVTGNVNLDPAKGPVDWPPPLREVAGVGGPVPMDGGKSKAPPGSAGQPSAGPAAAPPPASMPPQLAETLAVGAKRPIFNPPPPLSSAPTVPLTSVPRPQVAELMMPAPAAKKGSRLGATLAVISVMLVLACAGVAVGFFLLHGR